MRRFRDIALLTVKALSLFLAGMLGPSRVVDVDWSLVAGFGGIAATLFIGWLTLRPRNRIEPDIRIQKTGPLTTGRWIKIEVANKGSKTASIVGFRFRAPTALQFFEGFGVGNRVPRAKTEFILPIPHDVRPDTKVGPYDFWFSQKRSSALPSEFTMTCKVIMAGGFRGRYSIPMKVHVKA